VYTSRVVQIELVYLNPGRKLLLSTVAIASSAARRALSRIV
jgi:hypothetical protein